MTATTKHIKPLLDAGSHKLSRWIGYFGMAAGVMILLSCIQMLINISRLMQESMVSKGGFDYISVSKTITNDNMGKDNTFTDTELERLSAQPSVASVSPLNTNQFTVTASAGSMIPFSSDLFLESVNKELIDTLPPSFSWKPGQEVVPVIFSSEYLEMYNIFAPAQGLPQLSAKTITSVNLLLNCSGSKGSQNFRGNIVALSDRINSVLVPQSFLDWCNANLAGVNKVQPARVMLKSKDANDPEFISYLDKNGYRINKEKVKFGRAKGLIQGILGGMLTFAFLVIVLAVMLFSFYLQLMIARSKQNLNLLITLGYSPKWLTKNVLQSWIPIYVAIIIFALAVTEIGQFIFVKTVPVDVSDVSLFLDWKVIAAAAGLFGITFLINSATVSKEMKTIS